MYMQDRRPLAPAAVVKMVVKREDDSTVDVEYVCLFIPIAIVHLPLVT